MSKQKQLTVGLYLRFRTPEGKQSPPRPVLYDAKKRIRPGWCKVGGVAEQHPDCTYHLRYKRDGKDTWEAVGSDPNKAFWMRGVRSSPIVVPSTPPMPSLEPVEPPAETQGKFRLDEETKTYLTNCEKL